MSEQEDTREWSYHPITFEYYGEFGDPMPTREAAIHEAVYARLEEEPDNDLVGMVLTLCRVNRNTIVDYIPGWLSSQVIESLQEEAYERVSDVSRGWLEKTTEGQRESLQRGLALMLGMWARDHDLQPTFWEATDYEDHAITAEEVEAVRKEIGKPCL